MGCFFGCFRAKEKQQHFPTPSITTTTAAVRKSRVSQNPLSDLFVARAVEDFSSNGLTAPPEIVASRCTDLVACKEVDSSKQPVQFCTPGKHCGDNKGIISLEGTPTSCICDSPHAGRVLDDTTGGKESKKCPSTMTDTYNINDGENQIGSLQKHKNRPSSSQRDYKVEGSLSAWLKPVQHNAGVENCRTGRNPGDMPILGTVAAYWNDETRPPEIPLKWWDGNGIPNSTTKYREDQKVSWHVTPFEERLEKALSEEKTMSQRKHIKTTHTAFQDNEMDTAASQFQSLPQPKPVVSC